MEKDICIKPGKHTGNNIFSVYSPRTMLCFSFVAKPELNSNDRIRCTDWVTCRDFLNDIMKTYVIKSSSTMYKYGIYEPLDFDKLRLLISKNIIKIRNASSDSDSFKQQQKEIKERIFSGKKIINIYEQIAGWKPSKIKTFVNNTDNKFYNSTWLLTGPSQWMRASYMVSMLTLIMKIADKFGPLNTDDINIRNAERKLNNMWQNIIEAHGSSTEIDFDIEYLKNCAPKFTKLMQNNDKIFGKLEQKELFPLFHKTFHECGGINSLCTLNTKIKKLDELCEEYLID